MFTYWTVGSRYAQLHLAPPKGQDLNVPRTCAPWPSGILGPNGRLSHGAVASICHMKRCRAPPASGVQGTARILIFLNSSSCWTDPLSQSVSSDPPTSSAVHGSSGAQSRLDAAHHESDGRGGALCRLSVCVCVCSQFVRKRMVCVTCCGAA